MLLPKRTKFRKAHKGTSRQIEAARRTITRHIKRGGRVWIRVFPDKPISKKPLEVRMGKGKGNPEFWVMEVKPRAERKKWQLKLKLQHCAQSQHKS